MYVTPTHHCPYVVFMSIQQRQTLFNTSCEQLLTFKDIFIATKSHEDISILILLLN